MKKLKMRTTKYYNTSLCPNPFWTPEQWEKVAFHRSEPKRIKAMGYVWRAWERDSKGQLKYMRAEKYNDNV
jgi:hypothetical protein